MCIRDRNEALSLAHRRREPNRDYQRARRRRLLYLTRWEFRRLCLSRGNACAAAETRSNSVEWRISSARLSGAKRRYYIALVSGRQSHAIHPHPQRCHEYLGTASGRRRAPAVHQLHFGADLQFLLVTRRQTIAARQRRLHQRRRSDQQLPIAQTAKLACAPGKTVGPYIPCLLYTSRCV